MSLVSHNNDDWHSHSFEPQQLPGTNFTQTHVLTPRPRDRVLCHAIMHQLTRTKGRKAHHSIRVDRIVASAIVSRFAFGKQSPFGVAALLRIKQMAYTHADWLKVESYAHSNAVPLTFDFF